VARSASSITAQISPDSTMGWIAGVPDGDTPVGQDFLPPVSGPGPVTNDKAYPFVDDGKARLASAKALILNGDLRPVLAARRHAGPPAGVAGCDGSQPGDRPHPP